MYDNPQNPKGWPMDFARSPQDMIGSAARTARQLLPFAGGDAGPLSLLSPGSTVTGPISQVPALVSTAAGDIVAQAAAILDQETAKGIVAARNAPAAASPRTVAPTEDLVQQLHALIENVARAWPAYLGDGSAPAPAAPAAAAAAVAPLPELRPATPLRPGDQATITMTIRNQEQKTVSLTPAATPLLGSNGDRIAPQLLEFTPAQLRLDHGQQHDLRITVTVPARCAGGRYAGLLVVSGVDYLRALIVVDVSAP